MCLSTRSAASSGTRPFRAERRRDTGAKFGSEAAPVHASRRPYASRHERATRASRFATCPAIGAASAAQRRQPAQRVVETRTSAGRRLPGAAPPPCTRPCPRRSGTPSRTPCRQAEVERLGDRRAASPCDAEPSSISCSTRPGRGSVLLLPGGQVRRTHRPAGPAAVGATLAHSGAAMHGVAERPAVVDAAGGALSPSSRPARRRSASSGRGSTSTPGLSTLSGSNTALTAANSLSAPRRRSAAAARAGPAVPCSPDSDPPCVTSRGCRPPELPDPRPPVASNGKSIRTCTQPSPKCP